MPYSRGSSSPRDGVFTTCATWEAYENWLRWAVLSPVHKTENCCSARLSKLPKIAQPEVNVRLELWPSDSCSHWVPVELIQTLEKMAGEQKSQSEKGSLGQAEKPCQGPPGSSYLHGNAGWASSF